MPPFSWQEIKKDWLRGVSIGYSPSLVLDAFNSIEAFLGREYLQRIRGRGSWVIIPLIDRGLILKEIGPMENSDKLLERLRINDVSALAEPRLIAHYRRHKLPVMIEPEVKVNGKEKHPDFSVRYGNPWIHVEVASPSKSDEQKKIDNVMSQISRASELIEQPRKIDVFLCKLPMEKEIESIVDICLDLAEKEEQPCTYEVGEIGVITSRILKKEEENLLINKNILAKPTKLRKIYGGRPSCYKAYLKIGGFPTHTISRVHVYLPFTDERAERFIHDEKEQLSPHEHNMIALDITHITTVFTRSSTQDWINLVQRRLQPNLNRRISAVLLIKSSMNTRSVLVEKRLVEHPNPYKRLPDGFLKMSLNEN